MLLKVDQMGEFILIGTDIYKNFGGLQAVSGVSFEVPKGKVFAIIGPNGAGKTTLFNLISGVFRDYEGKILFCDEAIDHRPGHVIAAKGIARTFQNVRLFKNLSVLENVMVGCHGWIRPNLWRTLFGFRGVDRQERAVTQRAAESLRFVGLEGRSDQDVGSLPLGEQKLVEIARALAARPKLLLLDEPGAGLNDAEMEKLKAIIFRIKEQGITQIVVEHNMNFIMSISDRIMVLDFGMKIADGTPQEILQNEKVIEVYLGRERDLA